MAQTAEQEKSKTLTLKRGQSFIQTWWKGTATARAKMKRDFEYLEPGRQWKEADRREVEKTGRPAMEFNLLLPQVELVAGMQRGMAVDFTSLPRGIEDRRLGEIATAALKAAKDFTRLQRVTDKVFDDGTVCGLGAWEILHGFDDAEDMTWGDISACRINPLAFLYDVWAIEPDRQDGQYMGKLSWVQSDDLKERHPDAKVSPGEWVGGHGSNLSESTELGTGPNLQNMMYDPDTQRVRVATLWYKVPTTIALIVDSDTGQVQEVKSKADGEALLKLAAAQLGQQAVARYQVMTSDTESKVVDRETAKPVVDPATMQPMIYADAESANGMMDRMSQQAGMSVYSRMEVITRKAKVPRVAEMSWWEILSDKQTPFRDRKYPFVPYIARQFTDDPESIQGILRAAEDPQDDINKRRSNLTAHLNSSAHSGWLNPKTGGANKAELQLMGSKPGIVVDFVSKPPTQITPVPLSEGHFRLVQDDVNMIRLITSLNAELAGQTSQVTVSGRAIRARQEGGIVSLKPRIRNFEEAELDVANMLLSRIQQFYPPEKLRRIIGMAEMNQPLGPNGMSIFQNPENGQPMEEDEILALLSTMKNTKFDLVMRLTPESPSERAAQFQLGVELAALVTSSGRPLGPNTLGAMVDMSNAPTKLAAALKADLQQPQTMDPNEPGGLNAALQGFIANIRGGKAGGTEGSVVG